MTDQLHRSIREQLRETARNLDLMASDDALVGYIAKVASACVAALGNGHKVLFAGNGGSAADAQHLAAELVSRFAYDRPGLAAFALTTDTSVLTAIGNDYGYERLFARQKADKTDSVKLFRGRNTRDVEQCGCPIGADDRHVDYPALFDLSRPAHDEGHRPGP